jgi:hypothetical protein
MTEKRHPVGKKGLFDPLMIPSQQVLSTKVRNWVKNQSRIKKSRRAF